MAKKHKHEDHLNHEAWAIPYGDLVTLLLALFVVMYSMSAVNEGKFRVASASLKEAFGGKPRAPTPIQIGPSPGTASDPKPKVVPGGPPLSGLGGKPISMSKPALAGSMARAEADASRAQAVAVREHRQLEKMAEDVHQALGDLIAQKLVVVRRYEQWLEVEIQADILFASGSSQLSDKANHVLERLADTLRSFPNRLRIEGHTDDVPIATREFPSNWELSSARAASVVHRFMARGVAPHRMTVLGLAEYQPVVVNADVASRNRNRRVVIVILADDAHPAPSVPATAAGPDPAEHELASGLELRPAAGSVAVAASGRSQP